MRTDKINCVIIHGCPKNPEKVLDPKARYYHHWIPWVKRELTKMGIKTDTPLMPFAWHPDYQKFKKNSKNIKLIHYEAYKN